MIISIEQIGKRFNKDWVFRNFTGQFHTGEVIAITGPNGSGKSTLMQILWGQTVPSAGTIRWLVDSHEIDPSEIWKFISIAAPYQDLVDEYTLSEHIDFHFRYKLPVNGIGKKQLVSSLFLEDSLNKRIEHFSSGMRMRLRLGLALYSNVPVTFLDEPTTNLDEKGSEWFRRLVSSVSEKLIFIATNTSSDYPESSRIICMDDFKIK